MCFRNLNSAYHFSFFVIVLLLMVIRLYEFPSDPVADCEYRCSSMASSLVPIRLVGGTIKFRGGWARANMARAVESTRRRRRSLHA
jgi:hypothetical protein